MYSDVNMYIIYIYIYLPIPLYMYIDISIYLYTWMDRQREIVRELPPLNLNLLHK